MNQWKQERTSWRGQLLKFLWNRLCPFEAGNINSFAGWRRGHGGRAPHAGAQAAAIAAAMLTLARVCVREVTDGGETDPRPGREEARTGEGKQQKTAPAASVIASMPLGLVFIQLKRSLSPSVRSEVGFGRGGREGGGGPGGVGGREIRRRPPSLFG